MSQGISKMRGVGDDGEMDRFLRLGLNDLSFELCNTLSAAA
jgi:hypothetical protein